MAASDVAKDVAPASSEESAGRVRSVRASALWIFVLCFACYLANVRTMPFASGWDTIPNRLIPFSVLRFGTVTLDPFAAHLPSGTARPGYVQEKEGHLVSFYPVGASAVALPAYIPCYFWLILSGRTSAAELFAASEWAEKVASSAVTAMAVALMYALLRRRTSPVCATALALAFGLGTSVWAVASQQLWQHGPAVLCLLAGMLLLDVPEPRRLTASVLAWSGAAFGLAFACRPHMLVFAFAAGLVVLLWELRGESPARAVGKDAGGADGKRVRLGRVLAFAGGVLAAAAPFLIYNRHFYGSLLGGYALVTSPLEPLRIPEGLAGLLISPNRGLLAITPIAIFGILGLVTVFRRPRGDELLKGLALAAVPFVLSHAGYRDWPAGWTFPGRYLIEVLPILTLGAERWLHVHAGGPRAFVVSSCVWSFLAQVNGAFMYPASNWNARMEPDLRKAAWSLDHIMLLEDFGAWYRAGAVPEDPTRRFGAHFSRGSEFVSFEAPNPVLVPAISLTLDPGEGATALVTAVFDVTASPGATALFVGKLRVDNVEEAAVALFQSSAPPSRATISQSWAVPLHGNRRITLTLYGQVVGPKGSMFTTGGPNTILSAAIVKSR